jgi:hypothetical protein
LLTSRLMSGVHQAEHRQDRVNRNQTDTVDVEATRELIRAVLQQVTA